MAQQGGILQIRGKIGGMVFAKDGSVRQAPPSNKAQFNGAASMARTRENASEFGTAATAGKVLRDALRTLTQSVRGGIVAGRISAVMNAVLKMDTAGMRGQRQLNVAGLIEKLTGFEFNPGATLSSVFYAPFTATRKDEVVTLDIPSITPKQDLRAPQGATHYELVYAAVGLSCDPPYRDIPAAVSSVVATGPLPLDYKPDTTFAGMTLTYAAIPGPSDATIVAVGVKFYQEVNGDYYAINNGSNNPLAIVAVS